MYRVGVVGFGMAGAVAAYLLARDGHRVTLLERVLNWARSCGDFASVFGAGGLAAAGGSRSGSWPMPRRSKSFLRGTLAAGGRS